MRRVRLVLMARLLVVLRTRRVLLLPLRTGTLMRMVGTRTLVARTWTLMLRAVLVVAGRVRVRVLVGFFSRGG